MRLPFYTVTQSVSQSNSPQRSSPAFFLILGMFLLPTPLRSFCQSRYSSDCPSFVQYSIFLEGSIHKLTHPSHSFTHSYIYTSLFNSKHLLQKHRPSRGTISLRELFSLNPPDIFPRIYIYISVSIIKLNYTALDPTQEKLHCSSLSYYKSARHFKKGSLFFHIYKKSFCVFLLCLVPVYFHNTDGILCPAVPFSTPYESDSFSYPLLPAPSPRLSTTATSSTLSAIL